MYVYVNGKIIKEEEASISIFEHGFMYGLGVFETMRVYSGHPFLFFDHMKRLQTSVTQLGIKMKGTWKEEILSNVFKLLEKNNCQNAYIRVNISAGTGNLGLQVSQYENPTTIIYIKPILDGDGVKEKSLQLLRTRRNTPEGAFRIKSHHFLNNVLGKREIGDNKEVEGIFLTEKGYIAEGVVSNIFWVTNGVLYTPALATGILGGITRKYIICLAKKNDIPIKVGKFKIAELELCDEAFITNSIQEVVPVNKIRKRELTSQKVFTEMFKDKYTSYRTSLWSTDDLF